MLQMMASLRRRRTCVRIWVVVKVGGEGVRAQENKNTADDEILPSNACLCAFETAIVKIRAV